MKAAAGGASGRRAQVALFGALAVVVSCSLVGILATHINLHSQQECSGAQHQQPAEQPVWEVGPRLAPWVHNRSCLVYVLDVSKELAAHAEVAHCNIDDPKVRPLYSGVNTLAADCPAPPEACPWHSACHPAASPPTFLCLQVWPHGLPGRGVQAMDVTPHHSFQHAGPWWLTQALLNTSRLLTPNLGDACMVWVDMCVGWVCLHVCVCCAPSVVCGCCSKGSRAIQLSCRHCYNMAYLSAVDYGQPGEADLAQLRINRLLDYLVAAPRFQACCAGTV